MQVAEGKLRSENRGGIVNIHSRYPARSTRIVHGGLSEYIDGQVHSMFLALGFTEALAAAAAVMEDVERSDRHACTLMDRYPDGQRHVCCIGLCREYLPGNAIGLAHAGQGQD